MQEILLSNFLRLALLNYGLIIINQGGKLSEIRFCYNDPTVFCLQAKDLFEEFNFAKYFNPSLDYWRLHDAFLHCMFHSSPGPNIQGWHGEYRLQIKDIKDAKSYLEKQKNELFPDSNELDRFLSFASSLSRLRIENCKEFPNAHNWTEM